MDVSGWTLAKRMELPDWCFGNKWIIGCPVKTLLTGTNYWGISEVSLPDPVCIWTLGCWVRTEEFVSLTTRIGLRATIPTSDVEMDAAIEMFPLLGAPRVGPNLVRFGFLYSEAFFMKVRKGMNTDGLKLVVQVCSTVLNVYVQFSLLVSELPTRIPAHLDPNTI